MVYRICVPFGVKEYLQSDNLLVSNCLRPLLIRFIVSSHVAASLPVSYVKKDKIPGNEGAMSLVQKVILEMRVQELDR